MPKEAEAEVYKGFTFFAPGKKYHLYCVINDPSKHGNTALIVNCTSQKTMSDTSCRIFIGDHEFITKPTVVAYWGTETKECRDLLWEIKEGRYEKAEDFDSKVVERMRNGARNSPDLSPGFLSYL